jgi:dienelactone hydrolase
LSERESSLPAASNDDAPAASNDDAPAVDNNSPIVEPASPTTNVGEEAPLDVSGLEGETGAANADDSDDDDPTPVAEAGAIVRGPAPSSESATRAGPFNVDSLTQGLRDGPAYGSQTLFYPTDAQSPFAAVAIVPGFVSPESSIRQWGPFLASHGIVALTIGTNTGGDLPDVRARALMDALATVAAENDRPESPIAGQVALDRMGVMGWSMGGGGTLIAANENPELRAAISLAAWSPGAQFSNNQVPTLLFAGTADILAGGQSQGFFESIPDSTFKMLFEVSGGSHDVANAPSGAGGEVGRYGLSWLKVFLEGDERYRQFLAETPSTQSDFRRNLD